MRRITFFITALLALGPRLDLLADQHQAPTSQGSAKDTAAPAMTNQDVIKMAKVGLSSDIIVGAIASAPKKSFNLNPDALIALKTAGVTDAVIRAMQGGAPPSPPSPSAPLTQSLEERKSTAPQDAGLYATSNGGLTQLEPSVFSQAKTGGMFTSALTYGIKKIKWKAAIRGSRANQRVDGRCDFYFYFENTNSGLSNTGAFGGFMQGASSPNEFVLVRLTQNDNDRSVILGEFGAFGASSGARSQDTVEFKIEKLGPGRYKVTPTSLAPGEYAFFYAAGAPTLGAGNTGKLFDFGVD